MQRKLFTVHCLLFSSFLFLLSCQPTPEPPTETTLVVYRFDPPAFIEYSADFEPVKEIPFSIPPNCGLYNTFPAPIGQFIAIELSCPNGQTVLFLDFETDSTTQLVTASDSHFLAWTSDGKAAYLKADTLGNTQILRVYTDGAKDIIPITGWTYDLSAKPDSRDFIFTFSRGLGYGSELHVTQYEVRNISSRSEAERTKQLYADQYNYLSFARFSPDGSQIAFIKIPDTQTPFTVGELWLMDSDGANARKLAEVDAGHGYAANWSPDGKHIVFVFRENSQDENANQSSEALISNIHVVDVETGALTQLTNFAEGRVETPHWSPDGNTLAFNLVVNGRMNVHIADMNSGETRPLETGSTCCPAWMRK